MSETLDLPREVYQKLAQGAAERGMTIESLLSFDSDLVVLPDLPSDEDRQRSRLIDRMLHRFRNGSLSAEDRRDLDQLIEADYQSANARADQLINAKQRRTRNGRGK